MRRSPADGTGSWVASLLAAALALGSVPAAAQDLALKRGVPGEDAVSCPAVAVPEEPSREQRAEASELLAEANQAALLGDRRAALDYYRRVAHLDPTDAEVAYRLGRALEEQGETEAAAREYCRFLFLAPHSPDAAEVRSRVVELIPAPTPSQQAVELFREGIAAYDDGRPADAAEAFTRALRHAPAWTDLYYNRALAWEASAELRRAIRDFEQYLAIAAMAGDAEAVRDRIGALRAAVPGVTPSNALVRGLVVPGLGQFSTGRPVLGAVVLSGAGAAIAVALQTDEEVRTRTFVDPFGNPYQEQDTVSVRGDFFTGVALAAGIAVIGALEAYFYANRRERPRPDETRTQRGEVVALPSPLLRPARGGAVDIGLSVPLPLPAH